MPNKDKHRNKDMVWQWKLVEGWGGGEGNEEVGRCQEWDWVLFRIHFTYRHVSLILPVFALLSCLSVTSVWGDACWQGLQNAKKGRPFQKTLIPLRFCFFNKHSVFSSNMFCQLKSDFKVTSWQCKCLHRNRQATETTTTSVTKITIWSLKKMVIQLLWPRYILSGIFDSWIKNPTCMYISNDCFWMTLNIFDTLLFFVIFG